MGRELQKRKRRSSRPATRQPSSNRSKLMNPLGNSIVARNWNKNETTTQNYRRLGLVSRLRAPTGGVEKPRSRSSLSSSTKAAATAASKKNPFSIHGAKGPVATETQVERDEDGKIIRVISGAHKRANPLNDPLAELDTDSEADPAEDVEDAEEWGGFEGEEEQNAIVRQLESEANRPVEKKPRTASSREAEWLQSLVEHHGDDTRAMARDRKLNPMQQTAADLARRIRKMQKKSST
ncbi:ribosome biogenesis protein Nop16 [Astrocystis sublimbata]|nr:ribosome biogenesis protein Nop16 [Astrocystis sublimbata]